MEKWIRAAVMVGAVWAAPAFAEAPRPYDIAAQDLEPALDAFATISGREIVASSDILKGRRSDGVRGARSPEAAIAELLAGTGLRYRLIEGAFVIEEDPSRDAGEPTVAGDDGIVVTGSRIRGAPIASPKLTYDAEAIRNQGLATLGEVAQTIPQNFGGGQNPGIGTNVPTASGINVGSGTSLNLRGLGSDATLTLLNGRRLAYSSSRQSVDLSAIPAGIVERIEVVADGASAIYGSDAVAGVANIILRRDAQGLVTSARVGGSTDGGNEQQIYGATAGLRWAGGGSILAYEFGRNSAIRGSDRSYARTSAPGLDLYPEIERHNLAASVHQTIGGVTAALDALYNHRRSLTVFALLAGGDRSVSRNEQPDRAESYLVAPSLTASLGGTWRLQASGSLGRDKVTYRTDTFAGAARTASVGGYYRNSVRAGELSGDGVLVDLPAGTARLALGLGYRDNGLVNFRGAGNVQNTSDHQRSTYAYGEVEVPLLARASDGAAALRATAALRYERYPDLDDVATPKLGVILAPTPDVEFKASWGKSYRAPTLLQRYQPSLAVLFPASLFGATGLPPGSTALLLAGGREDLRPERARSWSATAALHPRAIDGVRFELSYFDTRYRDRIVSPIAFITQALSNPLYAAQITRAPSAAQVTQLVAGAGQFLNGTGAPLDPARVVAIVDNANQNAARQHIHGVDAAFEWTRALGDGRDRLSATLNASYLKSDQRLSASQPIVPLAGTLFNPPHFRARAIAGWSHEQLTLTGALNRIGGVRDPSTPAGVEVAGMTTADLTARLRTAPGRGLLGGLDLVLTAQNLFNVKPDTIATGLPYDTPYDSTNYSPVGRFLALSVSKTW